MPSPLQSIPEHTSDPRIASARLIHRTRDRADIKLGLSPRAGQGLLRAAQALALIAARDAVLPEDVQAAFPAVAGHRLLRSESGQGEMPVLLRQLIESVAVPE